MKAKQTLPFGFDSVLSSMPGRAAAAADEADGAALTLLALFPESAEKSISLPSLLDRGLAENTEGAVRVTDEGMKAVSLYPLLGSPGKHHPYPSAFFPFLLSAAASRTLPSGRWQRMLSSDFFTSLFPGIPPERIAEAAAEAMEALLRLGIAENDSGVITIRKKNAESFMALSEEERIAVVIDERTAYDAALRRKAALMIHAISHLSGISEEEAAGRISMLEGASGYSCSLEKLSGFSVIENDGGIISGRTMHPEGSDTCTISSDFSITCTGRAPDDLFLYAAPVSSDTTVQWKLTKASLKTAFSLGLTPDDVCVRLRRIASYELPETIEPRISGWYSSYSSIKAERALILTADERNARIIDALPTLKMHILGKLGENIFLMDSTTEPLWRRALENGGFDMLGPTSGPRFMEDEEERALLPPSGFSVPEIPEEREVPYDGDTRKKLLDTSDSPLRTALIASGFIVSESQETPDAEMVNGLYYQEKMRLIHAAIADGEKLYLEFPDGSTLIGRAEKEEDGNIAILGRSIDPAKVWKAARLPLSVRDSALPPSDSDSQ